MRRRFTVIFLTIWVLIFTHSFISLSAQDAKQGSLRRLYDEKVLIIKRKLQARMYLRRRSSKAKYKQRNRRVSRRGRGYFWLPGEDLPRGHIEGAASYYRWKGGMHAASLVAPKGSKVRVTNLETGNSIVVTINDHGPFVPGRVIDLDKDAFIALFGSTRRGVGPVALDW